MGIYGKYFLPRLVHLTCGGAPLMKQREKVVPMAEGLVLEIGIGSGLNIPFYSGDRVHRLWGLDPSRELWAMAEKSVKTAGFDVQFIQGSAEKIPLDDASMDTILVTYALCTIPNVLPALGEMRRVLKPRGNLIFCEHGSAPDQGVVRWQKRINPLWKVVSGGCHLNRPIPSLIERSGFRIEMIESMYIPGWKPASFNYWGSATPSPP